MKSAIEILTVALLLACPIAAGAQDDSPTKIQLKSGGQVYGTILSESVKQGKAHVVIKTASGSTLVIDKSRILKSYLDNPRTDLEYQRKLATVSDTSDGHWEMYQWCKKDKAKYADQIDFHLRRILAIDPSDKKAVEILNYVEVGGRWVPEEQHFLSSGYVRHNGHWISSAQPRTDKLNDVADPLNDRKKALRRWQQSTIRNADFETIRSELFKIVDDISVGHFIDKILEREKNPQRRLLYLEAIGRVGNKTAQATLIKYAIEDEESKVREAAILQLEQEHYGRAFTASRFGRYLANADNKIVNRAGYAMAEFDATNRLLDLISALKTQHRIRTGDSPGRTNTTFDSNGGAGLSTGGPEFVVVEPENPGVLQALTENTGKDFGYDAEAWRQWYIYYHTVTEPDLRGELNN